MVAETAEDVQAQKASSSEKAAGESRTNWSN